MCGCGGNNNIVAKQNAVPKLNFSKEFIEEMVSNEMKRRKNHSPFPSNSSVANTKGSCCGKSQINKTKINEDIKKRKNFL